MTSHLPRKQTSLAQSKAVLQSTAFQIGVIVSIERNRRGKSQEDVAAVAGVGQPAVSNIETGKPLTSTVSDAAIDAVFKAVGIGTGMHANFVKWWRDNN